MNVDIQVRLPGSQTPENIVINSDLTAREAVQVISQKMAVEKLSNSHLVIAPTSKKNGSIVSEQTQFKNLNFDPRSDVLELWKQPVMMNIAIYFREGGVDNVRDRKIIPIDLGIALLHMIGTIQRALDLPPDQEFSFQYADSISDNGRVERNRWVTTQLSLDEQECNGQGALLCCPIVKLMKTPETSLMVTEKGMLFKRSMKKDRTTSKQRRLFVLSGPFLFYYKKERDATPCGVIPLEYYVIRKKLNKKRKYSMMLTLSYDGFKSMTGSYKLQADTLESMESWFEKIKRKCVNSGNKKVFGVELKEVVMRKSNENRFVPKIVSDCIQFLDEKGTELEGVFRISASASIVEYYKDQYDSGENVHFGNIYDFHIPAALLKLYFRELPEPLITFDLYDSLIAAGGLPPNELSNRLGDIMAELPIEHFVTSKVLFRFLGRVAAKSDINKMGPANLATVFGPNLVRNREDESPQVSVEDFGIINALTQHMILHHQAIFERAETMNPKLQVGSGGGAEPTSAPRMGANRAGRGGMVQGPGMGPQMGAIFQQMKSKQQQQGHAQAQAQAQAPAQQGHNPNAAPGSHLQKPPRHDTPSIASPTFPDRAGGMRGRPPPVAPRRDRSKDSLVEDEHGLMGRIHELGMELDEERRARERLEAQLQTCLSRLAALESKVGM